MNKSTGRSRFAAGLLILLGMLALPTLAGEPGDLLVDYLERYQRLAARDVEGRLSLAKWCGYKQLYQQQADLLREVLELQPGHVSAYHDLLAADARRVLPVDKAWAEKLEKLIGSQFTLHHSPHFTILSDADEAAVLAQAFAMEETYQTFYQETVALGLRPMPPAGRLVCVLFREYEAYCDFLKRYEGEEAGWGDGVYSWRTNRVAFFHDQDHPVFREIRQKIEEVGREIVVLRAEMGKTANTAKRFQIQERLKELNGTYRDMTMRLALAARQATSAKTRHEATHQLLYNSGIQRRGREYPFWLSEGLATVFELCDKEGHAGPRYVNTYRLQTYRERQKAGEVPTLLQLILERPREQEESAWVVGRYAQVWALMHFLWNKHPDELRSYLEALDAEGTPRDWLGFFKAHFGEDLEGLERAFRRHVDALHAASQ